MDALVDAVILNSENHSIAELPSEIISKIFRHLRGRDLISTSLVCKAFNSAIGNSEELMDKIRIKALSNTGRTVDELKKLLIESQRPYTHLALYGALVDHPTCISFIKEFCAWKSIKLLNCRFSYLHIQIEFMTMLAADLEEIEFDNQFDHSILVRDVLPVHFSKLKKIKCGTLWCSAFTCNTLKVLEIAKDNDYQQDTSVKVLNLLRTNPTLEDLRITYDVLDAIFARSFNDLGINMRLKKFNLSKRSHEIVSIDSDENFQAFLRTQADCLEEVTIDLFVLPHCHRVDIICVSTLSIIFEEFTAIRMVVVSDSDGFLTYECPSEVHLNLVPNPNITELRLRFEKTFNSDELFAQFVKACPHLRTLTVRGVDQALLEYCARNLKDLEFIHTLSFKASSLPNIDIKFPKLQDISFCEAFIENVPELSTMNSIEKKNAILRMLQL